MNQIAPCEDAARMAALHATSFDRPWSEGELVKLLANPAVFALGFANDGVPEGFALAWAAAGDSELLTIAVKPECRRQGAGAVLVESVAAQALLRGAQALILDVAEDNHAARALYSKLGFEQVGRRKDYYLTKEGRSDALTLRRAL
jgi:ribosomal-protein-alanine N-acetyltransferase